ncbi:hypothetical protein MT391_11975 [Vibrio sp. 1-Bac 57]
MIKYLFAFLFISASVFASPNWYGQKHGDSDLILGYGQASTYQQAKSLAYSDLSTNIEVRVTKDVQSKKQFKDGKLTKTSSSESKTQTDVVFRNNVTVAHSELIDGQYYVAVQYNKTSFYQRLNTWLSLGDCQTKIPAYWQNVSLVKNWISQHDCLPQIGIERFVGGWQLTHQKGQLILPDTQYENLFFSHGSNNVLLDSTNSRLKQGEYYFINIETKKDGYLSLFQVYKDGSTGVLIENEVVQSNTPITFPDNNLYDGIEAILATNELTSFDVNVALLCQEKIDTSRFEKLDETPLSHDKPGFSLLLQYAQNCEFRMERLTINQ